MADFYDEVNVLVNNIAIGKVGKKETEQIIGDLKKKYGNDIFPSFKFQKQPMPWTKEYLHLLQKKNITGACSEEFILHMAEVSEYIALKKKKKIIGIVVGVIFIAVVTIFMSIASDDDRNVIDQDLSEAHSIIQEEDKKDFLSDNNKIYIAF